MVIILLSESLFYRVCRDETIPVMWHQLVLREDP